MIFGGVMGKIPIGTHSVFAHFGQDPDMKDAIELGLETGMLLPISEQIRDAKRLGLRLHVCVTTMTLFDLSQDDLIEEVDSIAGLGMFVDIARDASMSIYV